MVEHISKLVLDCRYEALQRGKLKITSKVGDQERQSKPFSGIPGPRFCKPSDSKTIVGCLQIRACKSTEHSGLRSHYPCNLQYQLSNILLKKKKKATEGTELLERKK